MIINILEHVNELKKHVDPIVLPDDVAKEDEENTFDFDVNADETSFQNIKIVEEIKTEKTVENKKQDEEEINWDDI